MTPPRNVVERNVVSSSPRSPGSFARELYPNARHWYRTTAAVRVVLSVCVRLTRLQFQIAFANSFSELVAGALAVTRRSTRHARQVATTRSPTPSCPPKTRTNRSAIADSAIPVCARSRQHPLPAFARDLIAGRRSPSDAEYRVGTQASSHQRPFWALARCWARGPAGGQYARASGISAWVDSSRGKRLIGERVRSVSSAFSRMLRSSFIRARRFRDAAGEIIGSSDPVAVVITARFVKRSRNAARSYMLQRQP